MVDLNNLCNNILNNFHINKKIKHKLYDLQYNDLLNLLNLLLISIQKGEYCVINDNILVGTKKNYKMEEYYILFEFIVNKFLINNNNDYDKTLYNNVLDLLLIKLTMLNKGQYLLEKLYSVILDINNIKYIEYINIASIDGTFITFKFWMEKIIFKEHYVKIIDNLLINSIVNPDDRIYKYLLEYITNNDTAFFQRNNIIKELITKIANSKIPTKYILKRLKFLSQKTNLNKYFIFMTQKFKNIKIIIELHKYYYVTSHTFYSLIPIYKSIPINYYIEYLTILLNLLKTEEEQTMLNIITLIQTNDYYCDFNKNIFEKIIIQNYNHVISFINWYLFINSNNEYIKLILKILTSNNLINKYLNESDVYKNNIYILFFSRFYIIETNNINNIIIVNKILHKLRILAKIKIKLKVINHNIKMYDILREIKTFTPNNNKNILKYGSIQYQYETQKYTNLPPRHLLPGEIQLYNNFIIREKADGILINNLPIDIYPNNEIINKYSIKAEYIEEIDLYLIFDIDIPNTTIIDRYNILRNNHSFTKDTKLNKINELKDYFELFSNERSILNNFLIHNDSIKWYPKFSCLVNDSKINDELINHIIYESLFSNKLNFSKPYKCDGFIITPLDGSREIKIKPLSLITIDILFSRNKWLDRDNNDLSNLIISNIPIKEGSIYRCKPIFEDGLKFMVDSYRYDKKKPNPYIVINSIINILNYDWKLDISKTITKYYYDKPKKILSKILISVIKYHKDILLEHIKKINPSTNLKWLDLGCGKGNLIPFIKKYNPNLYYGLDIDVLCLVKCLKYHDENQKVYIFNKCDLSNDWNKTQGKWIFPVITKFDYIIANFSLMYFFTDLFWEQLDLLVFSGTKFIFNIVSDSILNEWSESESFLKIENNKVNYKFEWIHNVIKTEEFISEENLINMLNKFKWKVISRYTDSKYELTKLYVWWIIEKI